jgi:hypothetical protein
VLLFLYPHQWYEDNVVASKEKKEEEEKKSDDDKPNSMEEGNGGVKGSTTTTNSPPFSSEEIVKWSTDPDQSKFRKVLKLADFGVGSLEKDKGKVTRGSMRHYAPEGHVDKMNYVTESDIFSFAYLMHEMMHGKRVFGN